MESLSYRIPPAFDRDDVEEEQKTPSSWSVKNALTSGKPFCGILSSCQIGAVFEADHVVFSMGAR
jgi:hypothetical protein